MVGPSGSHDGLGCPRNDACRSIKKAVSRDLNNIIVRKSTDGEPNHVTRSDFLRPSSSIDRKSALKLAPPDVIDGFNRRAHPKGHSPISNGRTGHVGDHHVRCVASVSVEFDRMNDPNVLGLGRGHEKRGRKQEKGPNGQYSATRCCQTRRSKINRNGFVEHVAIWSEGLQKYWDESEKRRLVDRSCSQLRVNSVFLRYLIRTKDFVKILLPTSIRMKYAPGGRLTASIAVSCGPGPTVPSKTVATSRP